MMYIDELDTKDAIIVMKTRLNMLEIKNNYKSKNDERTCELCEEEEECTEHLFRCKSLEEINTEQLKEESLKKPTRGVARYITLAMEKIKVGRKVVLSE